jgi:small subunit ribosomal protein S27Ae
VESLKHKPVRQSEYYKIAGSKVQRTKRVCPRCGEPVFMARHLEKGGKVRFVCGKCKMTVWE